MAGIFKEYDIRGIYQTEISVADAYIIGSSFAQFYKAKKLIVGRDGRLSSPVLHAALIRGITDEGVDVIDVGLVSTPMLSFAITLFKKDGIMTTASHNPKQYNGFKSVRKNLIPLTYSSDMYKIEKMYQLKKDTFAEENKAGKKLNKKEDNNKSNNRKNNDNENDGDKHNKEKERNGKKKKVGRVYTQNILSNYLSYLQKKFKKMKQISCIVDFSNGAGAISKKAFDLLNISHVKLFDTIDGAFLAHEPNTMENAAFDLLQKTVMLKKADLGVMFDGDADRVRFVDEKGVIVNNDLSFALLARHAASKKKGNFFFDLRFSKSVFEEIKKLHCKPIMLRVGNPFYKKALLTKKRGIMGGELSGHIMYAENYAIDDALFCSLKMIEYLSSQKKKLSTLISELSVYAQSGEINVHVKNVDVSLAKIKNAFKKYKLLFVDGISVYGKDFWFNVRKSQTEPLVRITVEADTKEQMERTVAEIKQLLLSS